MPFLAFFLFYKAFFFFPPDYKLVHAHHLIGDIHKIKSPKIILPRGNHFYNFGVFPSTHYFSMHAELGNSAIGELGNINLVKCTLISYIL